MGTYDDTAYAAAQKAYACAAGTAAAAACPGWEPAALGDARTAALDASQLAADLRMVMVGKARKSSLGCFPNRSRRGCLVLRSKFLVLSA